MLPWGLGVAEVSCRPGLLLGCEGGEFEGYPAVSKTRLRHDERGAGLPPDLIWGRQPRSRSDLRSARECRLLWPEHEQD